MRERQVFLDLPVAPDKGLNRQDWLRLGCWPCASSTRFSNDNWLGRWRARAADTWRRLPLRLLTGARTKGEG